MSELFRGDGSEHQKFKATAETTDTHPRPTPEEIDKKVQLYTSKRSTNENLYQEIIDQLFLFATKDRVDPDLQAIRETHFPGWEKEDFYELLKKLGETEMISELDSRKAERKEQLARLIRNNQKDIHAITAQITKQEEALEKRRHENERYNGILNTIKKFKTDALDIINERGGIFKKDTRILRLARMTEEILERYSHIPRPTVSVEPISPVSIRQEMMTDINEKTEEELLAELNETDQQRRELSERSAKIRSDIRTLPNNFLTEIHSQMQNLHNIQRVLSEPTPGFFKKDTRLEKIQGILNTRR